MRRLYPAPAADVDVQAVYADLDWPLREGRPFLALNMVSSVDGRATLHGSSAGIGSRADRLLMTVLRARADALLWGAGTLRAERVGKGVPAAWEARRAAAGLAPQPLLAVLTASGDVPLDRAAFAAPERIVVFVARSTPLDALARLRSRATVVAAGDERPEPARALEVLRRDYGVRHVLCEGGPALNHSLLTAGLLDELFLTLAPTLLAGDGLPLVAGPTLALPARLDLRSLYEHEGELYLRYAVSEGRAATV